MSNITKSNREHSFDAELAEIVGVEKAILLKNVSYWCAENKRRRVQGVCKEGVWYTAESVRSLAEKYRYMKKTSIGRWMTELHEDGWLRMIGQLGGKNLYSPGPVYEIWNVGGDWESVKREHTPILQVSQNGTPPEVSQNGTGVSQNGTVGVPKWDTMCPKMGHLYYSNVEELSYVEESATRAREKNGAVKILEVEPVDGHPGSASLDAPQKNGQASPGRGAAPSNPSPNSAAPLPFAASPWAGVTPAEWADKLLPLCDDLPGNLDAAYYLGRCRDWSAEKGGKSADWLATAARFAHEDARKNKLATIKTLGYDTNTGNSSTGGTYGGIDLARALARAERICRRNGDIP